MKLDYAQELIKEIKRRDYKSQFDESALQNTDVSKLKSILDNLILGIDNRKVR